MLERTPKLPRRLVIAAALAAGLAATAGAQEAYPGKPITIVVSAAAGAGTDFMARSLQEALSAELGKPVIIDNRGGSSGFIGVDTVKRAPNDGYTLLVTSDDVANWRAVGAHSSVNVLTDFEPVALLGTVGFFMVTSGDAMKAANVKELVELLHKRPDHYSYASPGTGSPQNLSMELFKQKTETRLPNVPYKGMGPAMTDVLAGRVQVMITGYPTFASQVGSGKIRVLGVAAPERSKLLPDVPTLGEQGLPGVNVQGYFSMFAPKGTPQPIVAKLNEAVNKALAMPSIREALEKRAVLAAGGSPQDLQAKLTTEIARWSEVVQAAGIKVVD